MEESKLISCRHCGNLSRMTILGIVNEDRTDYDEEGGSLVWGTHYSILKCPACDKVSVITYDWHDGMESEYDYDFLYPQKADYPLGLPGNILKGFIAAERVKSIEVNAYAILMRRLLELICIDRGAEGATLASMLKSLADKNEIPHKLVKVAVGLKDFGNIGAHAGSGELTEEEIPIVSALCTAILEYVYSAPYLATKAEENLRKIKARAKK